MNINKLPSINELIYKYKLQPKKSLGQNFLYDLNLTQKIANINGSLEGAVVLEVGAGPGALTRSILESGAKKVIAIEKDKECIPILQELAKFANGRLIIIQQDALSFDINCLKERNKIRIISNLPYNIGTELLVNWLRPEIWPPIWADMTLMFQKEVANRIVAKPGSKAYGRLSILSQWRSSVKIAMHLSPEVFRPSPLVHSSVVTFNANPAPKYYANPSVLEKIVKQGFNQRRKMLRSSLRSLHPRLEQLLFEANISPELRAENLTIADWCELAKVIEKN